MNTTTKTAPKSELQTYSTFRPTSFDCSGLGCEEQQDWLVCPVSRQPKTAGLLEDSNWEAQLEALIEADPEGNDHEVHYFGHWATDFEICLVRPGSAAAIEAARLADSLADYPVLNEEDHSQREHEAQLERIEDIVRDIERAADDASEEESEEWDCSELACEVSSELHRDLSELTRRATEQVTAILVSLGYLSEAE